MQQKIYYIRIYWTDGIFSAQCLFTKAAGLLWQHMVLQTIETLSSNLAGNFYMFCTIYCFIYYFAYQ